MDSEKIILGIDPGTMVMGYGVIREQGKQMESSSGYGKSSMNIIPMNWLSKHRFSERMCSRC